IVVEADAIQLPRLGRLHLKERGYLPVTGTPAVRVLSATVSQQAGHWYVSLQVEQDQDVPAHPGPVVGVDLGLRRSPRSQMAQSFPIRARSSVASKSSSASIGQSPGR